MINFIQKIRKQFIFRTITFKYMSPEMLEWSCLYDKEINMYFRAPR